jgi:hypothetical protein
MGLSFTTAAGFASAVILRSESRGTHDHILLSQTRDSLNLEGLIPVFISPRNRVALLYPQALGSLFVAYDSQGYGGGIRPHLLTELGRSSHIASEWTHRKHRFLFCCVLINCFRDVFTSQWRSKERGADPQRTPLSTPLLFRDVTAYMTRSSAALYGPLPSNGCFSASTIRALSKYTTICK